MQAFVKLFFAIILWASAANVAFADMTLPQWTAATEVLFASKLDLLDIKLPVDRMVDPATNPAVAETMIDRMTTDVNGRANILG